MYLMLFSSNNNIYSAWSKPYKWVINFTLVVNCLSSEQNHFPLKIHHIAPDVDKKYMYTKKNDELKLPTKNWISNGAERVGSSLKESHKAVWTTETASKLL